MIFINNYTKITDKRIEVLIQDKPLLVTIIEQQKLYSI